MCRPGQRPRQGHRQASRRSLTQVQSAGGALTRQAPRPVALKAAVFPTAVPEPAFAPVGRPWPSSGISVSIGSAAPAAPNPPSASHHNADLSSRARSRDPCVAMMVGTDRVRHAETHPTGESKNLSSPLCKNILIFRKCKSLYIRCCPVLQRGALAIVTNVGAGCGGRRECSRRKRFLADGEVVWS
jgi:hypothetical protein